MYGVIIMKLFLFILIFNLQTLPEIQFKLMDPPLKVKSIPTNYSTKMKKRKTTKAKKTPRITKYSYSK